MALEPLKSEKVLVGQKRVKIVLPERRSLFAREKKH